jgi:hypothetical protein
LVGSHTDDHWDATASGSPEAVLETIDDAAIWIRQRLKSGDGSSKLMPIICLDTDGAVCTWTKPEDTTPEMINAAIDQLDAEHDEDTLDTGLQSSMGERFPNLPLEVNYESLSDEQTSDGSRRAVLATPDVPARLLIDQLDSLGIRIGRVESIWTLVAQSWDPGAPHRSSARDSQRVISTDDPICGCVVLDPVRARLIWTWSKKGQLVAAGSMRIGHGSDGPTLHENDLSRLCTDWIGWAAQIGVAPLRVVMVLPEIDSGLDTGQIGSMFAKHWPTATTDLITEPDPILATLRATREAQNLPAGANASGSTLTNRPGRSHRSMYRWAGAALILGAAAVGWTAMTLYAQGSKTASEAKRVRSEMVGEIMKLQPPITDLRLPTAELQARLSRLVSRTGPMQVAPTKPVLEELETISFVLGMTGIEIDSIQLTHTLVKVKIRTKDLSLAEQINEALRSIEGSHLQWRPQPELSNRGEQIEATFSAVWNTGSSS